MNHLRAQLLGRFDLVCNERPLPLSSSRLQSLLAYLLLRHPTPQPRQQLAYLLWGDVSEPQARTNLRNLLFQLRQAWPLVDEFLAVDRHMIGWQPTIDLLLDVAQVEMLLHEGSLAALQQARTLYTGPLLPTLFDDWITPERDRLHAHFLTILDKLAAYYSAAGQVDEAILCTEELVRQDPLREESYRSLMRLYATIDDRARLEQSYRRCVATLQRELAVAPNPNTTDLYQSLLRVNPAQTEQPQPPSTDGRAHGSAPLYHFPAQSPLLIARPITIAQIRAQLLDANCHLLTLLGPGGMGKTSLAIATAQAVADQPTFVDGLYFVDLTTVTTPNQLLSALVRVLQLPLHDQAPPYQQLIHYLQARRLLLVLDNYEHLLPDLDLVAALLQQAPNVKLLVTSREALNLRAEKRFLAPGLTHPGQSEAVSDTPPVERYEAVDLFLRIATHLQPEFVLTQQARREIERICQLVDGSPLALEMAAGWLRLFDCHEIRSHLEASLDLLVAQTHDVVTRQQNMRTVIEQSWQLLTTAEQQILAQMAVFAGTFTSDLVMSITGARLVDLSVLIDKTFLIRRGGRLRLHELLRQFAAEKLRQMSAANTTQLRERHARAYLDRLTACEGDLFGARPIEAVRQLEPDLGNLYAAWRWASEAQKMDCLSASLTSLMRLLTLRHLLSEATDLLAIAIQHLAGADDVAAHPAAALYARLLCHQAETAYGLEDAEAAIALANKAERCAAHTHDLATQAEAQLLLGRIFSNRLQFDLAHTHLTQALLLGKQVGEETRLCALIFTALSKLHRGKSDYRTALAFQQQALTRLRTLGDREAEARSLYDLALIYFDTWQLQPAQAAVEQALALTRQGENPIALAECHFLIGAIHLRRGEHVAAQQNLEPVLAIAEQSGRKGVIAQTEQMLSGVYLYQGQPARARQALQRAIALYPAAGHAERVAECLMLLADLDTRAGNLPQARDHLLQALQAFQQLNYARGILHATGQLGSLYRLLGDYTQAQQALDQAILDCQTHHEESYLPYCYIQRAKLAQTRHDLVSAKEDAAAALAVLATLGAVENAIVGDWAQQEAQAILVQE